MQLFVRFLRLLCSATNRHSILLAPSQGPPWLPCFNAGLAHDTAYLTIPNIVRRRGGKLSETPEQTREEKAGTRGCEERLSGQDR